MDKDYTSVFNSLSQFDRFKLRSAAFTTALTGFAKDDTQVHPARYPLYAVYIALAIVPLPIPIGTVLIGATLLWMQKSKTELAGQLRERLKNDFNHAALAENHKDFLYPDSEKPETYRVKNLSLLWGTTKKVGNDSWAATTHAWKALKNWALG